MFQFDYQGITIINDTITGFLAMALGGFLGVFIMSRLFK